MLRAGLQTALRLIYPTECLGCGAPSDTDKALCGPCWRDSHFLTAPICAQCSLPIAGESVEAEILCDTCHHNARGWRRGRAAVLYKGTGRRIALALKHGDRHDLADPAARWMAAISPHQSRKALVVPVPLHWTRFLKRKFNQSALLAKYVAKDLGLEMCPDALVRRSATPSLDGKTREERFETLNGTIIPHPQRGAALKGRDVLLIDDVMTSGATLAACTDACISNGARNVDVLVLARVARDDYVL